MTVSESEPTDYERSHGNQTDASEQDDQQKKPPLQVD